MDKETIDAKPVLYCILKLGKHIHDTATTTPPEGPKLPVFLAAETEGCVDPLPAE